MQTKMLGKKRDLEVCCAGHDPLVLGSRKDRRKWVRINRRRENAAWRKEL